MTAGEKQTNQNLPESTAAQQVSNRSILRIQQLSDELKDQLNRMRLFAEGKFLGPVKEIFLAARDHGFEHTLRQSGRWYNFRLTASYDFDNEDKKWIAHNRNREKFRAFFRLAHDIEPHTAATYDQFEAGVDLWGPDGSMDDPARKAFDQFMIALAVIPYRGVLPSLLEEKFRFTEDGPPKDLRSCFLFHSPEAASFKFAGFDEFQAETWKNDMDPMPEFEPTAKHRTYTFFADLTPDWITGMFKDAGEELLKAHELAKKEGYVDSVLSSMGMKAILEFTRGQASPFSRNLGGNEIKTSSKASNQTPKADNPEQDLRGLVLPAYDTWTADSGFQGGMVGWLVVILEKPPEEFLAGAKEIEADFAMDSWGHFIDLVNTFVRRVREAGMRDLLEDYALPSGSVASPNDYFLSHLHQVIGWKADTDGETEINVPLEKGEDKISCKVRPILDTRWENKSCPFPPGTRRLCRLSLDELQLVVSKRKEGQESGIRKARELQEFLWTHETRKLCTPLVECDQPLVRNMVAKLLNAMTYPPRGEEDSLSEHEDLRRYWPPPFAISTGTAKNWMLSLHDFAACTWAFSSNALSAAALGDQLENWIEQYRATSESQLQWAGIWDDLMIDDSFPNPARKFFTRVWLAAYANYFKHRGLGNATPPCILGIQVSQNEEILLISQKNLASNVKSDPTKMGTKDVLLYDLMNIWQWGERNGYSFFSDLKLEEVIELVKFEISPDSQREGVTQFVTQIPIPRAFFL